MNPTITVLICVHSDNHFHDSLLIRSLESLNEQTYKSFNVLIVLDQCWINTEKIIHQNKNNLPITVVKKERKTGLADAKNFGISLINTDYVAFLDADDYYLPTKIEKQIEYIKNSDVDFLGCHSWNINGIDENNLFPSCFDQNRYNTHEDISQVIENENIITHGSMLIKKTCLNDLNGYNNLRGVEDWDLWKRAIKKGYKFYQLNERLYVYRLNTSVKR